MGTTLYPVQRIGSIWDIAMLDKRLRCPGEAEHIHVYKSHLDVTATRTDRADRLKSRESSRSPNTDVLALLDPCTMGLLTLTAFRRARTFTVE